MGNGRQRILVSVTYFADGPRCSLVEASYFGGAPAGGFPGSSVGKESSCNAGNPGSIPGSGRFAGEGKGYPLQYSWASPVVQVVKNLSAMRQTWI